MQFWLHVLHAVSATRLRNVSCEEGLPEAQVGGRRAPRLAAGLHDPRQQPRRVRLQAAHVGTVPKRHRAVRGAPPLLQQVAVHRGLREVCADGRRPQQAIPLVRGHDRGDVSGSKGAQSSRYASLAYGSIPAVSRVQQQVCCDRYGLVSRQRCSQHLRWPVAAASLTPLRGKVGHTSTTRRVVRCARSLVGPCQARVGLLDCLSKCPHLTQRMILT